MQIHRFTPVFIVCILCHSSIGAIAQDGPPGAESDDPTEPAGRSYTGSVSVGGGLVSGVSNINTFFLNADLTRPFSNRGALRVNFSHDFNRAWPYGTIDPTTGVTTVDTKDSVDPVSDRTSASVAGMLDVTKYTTLGAVSMWVRDMQYKIDSRFEELVGYGLHLSDQSGLIQYRFIPGVSVYKQDLQYAPLLLAYGLTEQASADWQTGVGFAQSFSGVFQQRWSVTSDVFFRKNTGNAQKALDASIVVQSQLTQSIGLQWSYQFNYESVVPPGGWPNHLSMLTAGMNFSF